MIEIVLAAGAAYGGYKLTKKFVVKKLRFVPKARSKAAPWVAGAAAAILALPIAGPLPLISGFTALAFGAGVGGGVASGDKEIKNTNVWGDSR